MLTRGLLPYLSNGMRWGKEVDVEVKICLRSLTNLSYNLVEKDDQS